MPTSDPHVNIPWNDLARTVCICHADITGAQFELNRFCGVRLQVNASEAFQLTQRRLVYCAVRQVNLRHLI